MKNETLEKAIELREKIIATETAIEQLNCNENPFICICASQNIKSGRIFLTPGYNNNCSDVVAHDVIGMNDFIAIKQMIRVALEKKLENLKTEFDEL